MAGHRHFVIEGSPSTEQYQYTGVGRGPSLNIPARDDRPGHGKKLRQDLTSAAAQASQQGIPPESEGISLEFSGEPGFDLAFDSLDPKARLGIELSNVRRGPNNIAATVYVPPGKLDHFFRLIDRCSKSVQDQARARRGQKIFDSTSSIRLAAVKAFWTDNRAFPEDTDQKLWWEVWVRSGNNQQEHDAAFQRFSASLGDTPFEAGTGSVRFPERLVLLIRGSVNDWTEHPETLNLVAELRLAKEVPTDLIDLSPADQREWAEDTASRLTAPATTAPAVCLLDTGVWREHPLLEPSLDANDTHTVDPRWGKSDDQDHGTRVAGLALYGQELQPFVEGNYAYTPSTRLESVKILPPRGSNDPKLYGYITQEGVARAETAQPKRPRTVCLTITSDSLDQGYPSAWSAAIDAHSSGSLDDQRRLYVVAAGNYRDLVNTGYLYPSHNHELAGVEDPAQSWNALTVGAYTDRVSITHRDFSGWSPVAPADGLSPASRTSMMWAERAWPLKPDLVMEGGNWARDGASTISPCTDLELLTTIQSPTGRLFDTMRDTSAATPQAALMAAQIQSLYPSLWPETVRALLVHSARWTGQMQNEFPGTDQETLHKLLRCYGYGVPNLDRALWSLENQVCLVAEGELQPFREDDGAIKSNEMHIHSLPWPVEELQRIGAADVTVRITLSYFIEPSPGRRGWTNKFRYQSHGLRFKLRGPLEKEDVFRQRISRAFWDEEDVRPEGLGEPQSWALGRSGLTERGSIHCNWWNTSAAELADCGEVAVFPVGGWWKERKHLEKFNRRTRYALVISIETPETTAELYTAIANKIAVQTQITT